MSSFNIIYKKFLSISKEYYFKYSVPWNSRNHKHYQEYCAKEYNIIVPSYVYMHRTLGKSILSQFKDEILNSNDLYSHIAYLVWSHYLNLPSVENKKLINSQWSLVKNDFEEYCFVNRKTSFEMFVDILKNDFELFCIYLNDCFSADDSINELLLQYKSHVMDNEVFDITNIKITRNWFDGSMLSDKPNHLTVIKNALRVEEPELIFCDELTKFDFHYLKPRIDDIKKILRNPNIRYNKNNKKILNKNKFIEWTELNKNKISFENIDNIIKSNLSNGLYTSNSHIISELVPNILKNTLNNDLINGKIDKLEALIKRRLKSSGITLHCNNTYSGILIHYQRPEILNEMVTRVGIKREIKYIRGIHDALDILDINNELNWHNINRSGYIRNLIIKNYFDKFNIDFKTLTLSIKSTLSKIKTSPKEQEAIKNNKLSYHYQWIVENKMPTIRQLLDYLLISRYEKEYIFDYYETLSKFAAYDKFENNDYKSRNFIKTQMLNKDFKNCKDATRILDDFLNKQ